MRLNKHVLLEIVVLVQDGIMHGRDISENLRQLDLDIDPFGSDLAPELKLSDFYLRDHPRTEKWDEEV